MRDGNSKDYSNVEEKLKQLNEKVTKLYGILEKFGLDVITKMGHTNLLVNKLTDKVEKLYNTIIDIKSLSPQLNNIIEGQREIEDEIGLLKILLSNLKFSRTELNDKAIVTEQENSSDKKNQILNQFKNIKEAIISDTSPSIIKDSFFWAANPAIPSPSLTLVFLAISKIPVIVFESIKSPDFIL